MRVRSEGFLAPTELRDNLRNDFQVKQIEVIPGPTPKLPKWMLGRLEYSHPRWLYQAMVSEKNLTFVGRLIMALNGYSRFLRTVNNQDSLPSGFDLRQIVI